MNSDNQKIRALGLCSGGLDSILAALVLQKQGIDVEWVSFETPFFSADKARRAFRQTGIPLSVQNITPIYLEMLKNPSCGYGQHLNPCMDCHALMFRLAGELMKSRGFHFLFSGEVAGQRPMSQTKSSLRYVEKHSGFEGYIVRPLSALILPPSIPEENGWVNRSLLLGLNGRSRKSQMKLAEEFGIKEFPTPAGGCLLTEDVYSTRLKDVFEHQETQSERELHLLKYGRHLRLDPQTKIIVGRHRQDNEHIMSYYDPQEDVHIHVKDIPGPAVLMPRGGTDDMMPLAASICVSYSKAPKDLPVNVEITTPNGTEIIQAKAIEQDQIMAFFISV
jgi:tRNA U34 2-thiouridine synthase MnmA/TrmU